jgi:hypothetical protein
MKKSLLALLLSVVMFATACSTSWLTTFDNYVVLAAPAVVEVVVAIDAAKGKAPNPVTLAKINGDAAALENLAQSISKADAQNLPNACAAFNVGVKTFAADVPTLEQLSGISDPTTLAAITSGIGIIQVVITSIEQPISACQASSSNREARKALATGFKDIASPSEFATQFNACKLGAPIHLHSKVVRDATLGIEK